MGLRQILTAFGTNVQSLFQARRLSSMIFSGTPVLKSISALPGTPPTWSLVFKNGLMLTLGEAGILDYQDREFGQFIGEGPGKSAAPDNREFLVQLHKLVLKSLLRFITHPGLKPGDRERAAEAATKLWLASESPAGSGSGYFMAGGGALGADAARESAPLR